MSKTVTVGGAALIWTWVNNVSLHLFNVSITVVFLSTVGAWLSYSYADDTKPSTKPISRKKLYLSTITNTLLAIACVAVLPQMLGWTWYNTKIEGSVAFLFAFLARRVAPLFLEYLPEIFRKWFRIGEYKAAQEQPKENSNEGL